MQRQANCAEGTHAQVYYKSGRCHPQKCPMGLLIEGVSLPLCALSDANAIVIFVRFLGDFRTTLLSRPNKVGLKCLSLHMYVRPSTKVSLILMKFGM